MNVKEIVNDYIKFRNDYYAEAHGRAELPVGASDEFIATLFMVSLLTEDKNGCCGSKQEATGNAKGVHDKNGKALPK